MTRGSGKLRLAVAATAAACLVLTARAADAAVTIEQSYLLTSESVELDSGSIAAYEYTLQAGSELVFNLRTARWRRVPLRIWLLDEYNYERMFSGRTFDYLARGSGLVDRVARIDFPVPKAGTYFLVLDNSDSAAARDIDVYAYARTDEASAADQRVRQLYQGYYDRLRQLVDLRDLEVEVRRCGAVNAFTTGSLIVICRELDELLREQAPAGVALFVFLHEVSHRLIRSWGYRQISTDQRAADQLAVTLYALLQETELAGQAARWFQDPPGHLQGDVSVDTFPLSRARAQRVAEWLDGRQDLSRGWTRRIVIPRIRTPALEELVDAGHVDARTRRRIERELSARGTE